MAIAVVPGLLVGVVRLGGMKRRKSASPFHPTVLWNKRAVIARSLTPYIL